MRPRPARCASEERRFPSLALRAGGRARRSKSSRQHGIDTMGRRLLAGLATVLVAGVTLLPAGRGQPPPPPGGAPSGPPGGGAAGGGAAAPALPGSGLANDQTPVLQYAVA